MPPLFEHSAYHENAHLLLGEEAGKELCKGQPHLEEGPGATPLLAVLLCSTIFCPGMGPGFGQCLCSGVYMQFSHARSCVLALSAVRKWGKAQISPDGVPFSFSRAYNEVKGIQRGVNLGQTLESTDVPLIISR